MLQSNQLGSMPDETFNIVRAFLKFTQRAGLAMMNWINDALTLFRGGAERDLIADEDIDSKSETTNSADILTREFDSRSGPFQSSEARRRLDIGTNPPIKSPAEHQSPTESFSSVSIPDNVLDFPCEHTSSSGLEKVLNQFETAQKKDSSSPNLPSSISSRLVASPKPLPPYGDAFTDKNLEFTSPINVREQVNLPKIMCMIRHAERLDIALENAKESVSTQLDSISRSNEIAWEDEQTRPYDTPVTDVHLAALTAYELNASGLFSTTSGSNAPNPVSLCIISSPFRRCLQTAGEIARNLDCSIVHVHLGLGERMDKVRQEYNSKLFLKNLQNEAKVSAVEWDEGVPQSDDMYFTYISKDKMEKSLGKNVFLGKIWGVQPSIHESAMQSRSRFSRVLGEILSSSEDEILASSHILCVGHGDSLGVFAESFCRCLLFEADYCGWLAAEMTKKRSSNPTGVVFASNRVQMMPLDSENDYY